jgi:hypothetical protein
MFLCGMTGIVDCVAVVGDTVCLVDWKTSEKTKHSLKALYDAPLQLAAYIGQDFCRQWCRSSSVVDP